MTSLRRAPAALAVLSLVCAPARATPAPPDVSASPLPAEPEDEARAHFERGVELLQKSAWADALAAFSASRQLYPTPPATINAAFCLRKLGRYDEALDLVDWLLRASPDLPEPRRQAAQREQAELAKLVGTLVLEGAGDGALAEIDGRARGGVPADGRLRVAAGRHAVRVRREGFVPFAADVEIIAGETTRVEARLRPVPPPPPPPRFGVELDGAVAISPPLGADLARSCTGTCSAGPGLGGYGVLRFGYRLTPRLDVGAAAGFLATNQSVRGRTISSDAIGGRWQLVADDSLKLRGGLVGAWAGTRIGAHPFVQLRLGLGALLGTTGDQRAHNGSVVGQRSFAAYLHATPEVRVGWRVGERVTLTAGVAALVLFGLVHPTWDPAATPLAVQGWGVFSFPAESFAGDVKLVVAPGAGVQYEF